MSRRILAADKLSSLRQVDPHNTALANGYRNPAMVGVTDIYPIVRTPKEAGKFTNWGPEPYIPIDKLRTAMGAKRLRIDVSNASGAYQTAQFEVEVPIYDRELAEIIDDDRETYIEKKTLRGQKVSQLGMEVAIANRLQDATKYDAAFTTVLAGANQWQDTVNSNPLNDLRTWIRKLRLSLNVDQRELAVGIGPKTYEALTDHPKVLSRTVGTTGKDPDETRIAEMLRVGSVKVLAGSYAITVDETTPDNNVFADLWGDVVVVYRPAPAKSDPETPLPGAVVRKDGFSVVEEYIDASVSGGPAIIKVTKDNWGIVQVSNKRLFLAKNVSGLP